MPRHATTRHDTTRHMTPHDNTRHHTTPHPDTTTHVTLCEPRLARSKNMQTRTTTCPSVTIAGWVRDGRAK
eukprot:150935-Prorocentrum_lima.AAC.1